MDATDLLPTPRNVLRTMRWSFDLLLWSQKVTRQVVCGVVAPLLPVSLRQAGRTRRKATDVGREASEPIAELPVPASTDDLLPAVRPSFGSEALVEAAGIAPPPSGQHVDDLAEPQVTDDLTCINGIGPRMAERLAHLGVTSLIQLAAWTPDDIAEFEEHLPAVQRGKAMREGWVDQARALVAANGSFKV
jgi:predicted flap endonuclease-1-like 5' DNA nuclease